MNTDPDPALLCHDAPTTLPCFLVRDEELLLFLGHDPSAGLGFPTAVDGEAVRVILPADVSAANDPPPRGAESWDACVARSPTDHRLYRIFPSHQHRQAFQAKQAGKWICVEGTPLCGMLVAGPVGCFTRSIRSAPGSSVTGVAMSV